MKVILPPKHTDGAEVIVPAFTVEITVSGTALEVNAPHAPVIKARYWIPAAKTVLVLVITYKKNEKIVTI